MSVGRSLAGVLTPIYLALEGFSAFELSEYVLVVAAVSAMLVAVIGTVSDQVGRRPFLVVLPLLTALTGVTFAFSNSHTALFLMGALGSFGRGSGAGGGAVGPYQPAESAFVTDMLPDRHRNSGFGRLAFGSSLGAMVGSLLGLLVPSVHVHGAAATAIFRDGFLAVAAASALAGILALGLNEPPRSKAPTSLGQEVASLSSWLRRSTLRRPRMPRHSRWLLYRLWITNSFNGVAVGMFGPFVTYWFFRRFGAGASEVGVLFAIINAATMVSTLSAAGFARRFGLVRTVAAARTAQALLLLPLVAAPSFAIAGAVYFTRMVVQRVGLPLRQSYAVGLAHPDERASVAALSNLPAQLAMAGSPLLTGYLMQEVSLDLPFDIAAAFQLLNATTFWMLFRSHPPSEELDAESLSEASPGRHEESVPEGTEASSLHGRAHRT